MCAPGVMVTEGGSRSEANSTRSRRRDEEVAHHAEQVCVQSDVQLVELRWHLLSGQQSSSSLQVGASGRLLLPPSAELHSRDVLRAQEVGGGTTVPQGVRHVRCVTNPEGHASLAHERAEACGAEPGKHEGVR